MSTNIVQAIKDQMLASKETLQSDLEANFNAIEKASDQITDHDNAMRTMVQSNLAEINANEDKLDSLVEEMDTLSLVITNDIQRVEKVQVLLVIPLGDGKHKHHHQ